MTSNVQLVPTTSVDALNKTLDTPPLDPVVLAIANDFLSGKSIEEMSDEYGVSQDRITSVVEKKEVKIYIDSVFATQGYLNRVKRINLINQVIDQKIADAVETGVYSKKDLSELNPKILTRKTNPYKDNI